MRLEKIFIPEGARVVSTPSGRSDRAYIWLSRRPVPDKLSPADLSEAFEMNLGHDFKWIQGGSQMKFSYSGSEGEGAWVILQYGLDIPECSNCGRVLELRAKFCGFCGSRVEPSKTVVASTWLNSSGIFYHGTSLRDAQTIAREGFRISRGVGRGGLMGVGVYMGSRKFAEGYARDVSSDQSVESALLHLRVDPSNPLSTEPSEWSEEFREAHRSSIGPVPAKASLVNWPEVSSLARRLGHDSIIDPLGRTSVVFNPRVITVIDVESL